MESTPIYITTPIYYPNDIPHLGTAYTTVAADISVRWARLNGRDAFFLTGLDEHGKKIENAARKQGLPPQDLVDGQAEVFKAVFGDLDIKYDRFIRTTDEDHRRTVQEILKRVYAAGDIYKGTYEGLYCVDCEAYYTEKELVDECCPLHHRPVESLSEDCYYFRLSHYREWLLEYYADNPEFISPRSRRNEVVSFVTEGLADLNISRNAVKWGIPLPFDESHVAYVWFDALLNYITGLGFVDMPDQFQHYWPSSTHLIGKDILRFHAVIWPAMLRSAGIEPPNRIFAHGFWTRNGQKFSKSLGNAISPTHLIDAYGLDPVRYYMFRAFSFGGDGDFSDDELVRRNNSDLAQGLGNLVQRVISMIEKYCDGKIPVPEQIDERHQALIDQSGIAVKHISIAMDAFAFQTALEEIWNLVGQLNAFINETEPWKLAKRGETAQLNGILATLAEGVRLIATLTSAFMPASSLTIIQRLGLLEFHGPGGLIWGNTLIGKTVKQGEPIFRQLVSVDL